MFANFIYLFFKKKLFVYFLLSFQSILFISTPIFVLFLLLLTLALFYLIFQASWGVRQIVYMRFFLLLEVGMYPYEIPSQNSSHFIDGNTEAQDTIKAVYSYKWQSSGFKSCLFTLKLLFFLHLLHEDHHDALHFRTVLEWRQGIYASLPRFQHLKKLN